MSNKHLLGIHQWTPRHFFHDMMRLVAWDLLSNQLDAGRSLKKQKHKTCRLKDNKSRNRFLFHVKASSFILCTGLIYHGHFQVTVLFKCCVSLETHLAIHMIGGMMSLCHSVLHLWSIAFEDIICTDCYSERQARPIRKQR